MSSQEVPEIPPTSYASRLTTGLGDIIELTYESLDQSEAVKAAVDSVRHDGAGAIALFIGTTRDNFQGKKVTRLEYQAYTSLAMKTLSSIVTRSHNIPVESGEAAELDILKKTNPSGATKERSLLRSMVIHRLGLVPVGQTSIIIAVASPHRREAFEACEWILEEVKLKAQIWKREWYAGSEREVVARDGGSAEVEEADQKEEVDVTPVWKANFPPAAS